MSGLQDDNVYLLPKINYLPEIENESIELSDELMMELYGDINYVDNVHDNSEHKLSQFTGDFEDFKTVQPVLEDSIIDTNHSLPSLPTLDDPVNFDNSQITVDEDIEENIYHLLNQLPENNTLNLFNSTVFSPQINSSKSIYSFDPPVMCDSQRESNNYVNLPPIYDSISIWSDYREILNNLKVSVETQPEESVSEMVILTKNNMYKIYKTQGDKIFKSNEHFKEVLIDCQTKHSTNILAKGNYISFDKDDNINILFDMSCKNIKNEDIHKFKDINASVKLSLIERITSHLKTFKNKLKCMIWSKCENNKTSSVNDKVEILSPEEFLAIKLNKLYESNPNKLEEIKDYFQSQLKSESN